MRGVKPLRFLKHWNELALLEINLGSLTAELAIKALKINTIRDTAFIAK